MGCLYNGVFFFFSFVDEDERRVFEGTDKGDEVDGGFLFFS